MLYRILSYCLKLGANLANRSKLRKISINNYKTKIILGKFLLISMMTLK